jgi:hypothetical protein
MLIITAVLTKTKHLDHLVEELEMKMGPDGLYATQE